MQIKFNFKVFVYLKVSEIVLGDLKGRDEIINAEEAHQKIIKTIGFAPTAAFLNTLANDTEKYSADILDPERKQRILTFFKGLSKEATLDETKATFVSRIFVKNIKCIHKKTCLA